MVAAAVACVGTTAAGTVTVSCLAEDCRKHEVVCLDVALPADQQRQQFLWSLWTHQEQMVANENGTGPHGTVLFLYQILACFKRHQLAEMERRHWEELGSQTLPRPTGDLSSWLEDGSGYRVTNPTWLVPDGPGRGKGEGKNQSANTWSGSATWAAADRF